MNLTNEFYKYSKKMGEERKKINSVETKCSYFFKHKKYYWNINDWPSK